jgi:hypothetical protein
MERSRCLLLGARSEFLSVAGDGQLLREKGAPSLPQASRVQTTEGACTRLVARNALVYAAASGYEPSYERKVEIIGRGHAGTTTS